LEEESRRPHAVRQAQTPLRVIERILALREEHPRWSRGKLAVLLEREGIKVSGSTVGRVMARLRARGVLVEPENVRQAKLARKRRRKPRYAVRDTTNHYGATGDGLIMAYRAGAKLLYMDSVQYHPTGASFPEQIAGFLIMGASPENSSGQK
jgi:hypothetical protein